MITKAEIEAVDGTQFPALSFQKNVLAPIFDIQKEYYFRCFIEMTKAHVIMLSEQGLVTPEDTKTILKGILEVEQIPFEEREYDPHFEDMFFMFEKALEEKIGSTLAGRVHTARSRNDIGVGEFRMVMRQELVKVKASILRLKDTLLTLISENFDTVMPMYTHTQPAQPSTLSHYLLSMYDVLTRDMTRLTAVEKSINRSPLGAAAITTTGFPISRERVSELLGFDGLLENSYDCIAAADHTMEFAGVLQVLAVDMSRFMKDVLDYCTKEFGFFYLADGYVQKSSIMPQKRNPSSLEHCRPIISKAMAEAQAIFTIMHNTPYGDIVDSEEELQEHLYRSVGYIVRAMDVTANVLGTMQINKALLLQRAHENFITVTELADTLVREVGLSFREGHSITSAIVRKLYGENLTADNITQDFLNQVSREVLGRQVKIDADVIKLALDPVHFVEIRSIVGGPSPKVAEGMYKERLKNYAEEMNVLRETKNKYERAHEALTEAVSRLIDQ